jgi:hypothetical protein
VEVLASDWGGFCDDVWLRFAGAPRLRLACAAAGHGFVVDDLEPESSRAPSVESLADRPPFARVMNAEVDSVGVFTFPDVVGFRLYFRSRSVSIVNLVDEVELYDGPPPYAVEYARKFGLAEHRPTTGEGAPPLASR